MIIVILNLISKITKIVKRIILRQIQSNPEVHLIILNKKPILVKIEIKKNKEQKNSLEILKKNLRLKKVKKIMIKIPMKLYKIY